LNLKVHLLFASIRMHKWISANERGPRMDANGDESFYNYLCLLLRGDVNLLDKIFVTVLFMSS